MHKFIRIISLFIFVFYQLNYVEAHEAKKSLAVCALFQNETQYLPEWIEFHEKLGVSHFFLYNNCCIENWQEALKKYLDSGLVEVIDWPHEYININDWIPIQCTAFMDAASKATNKYTWCAFLDTDEFLFSVEGKSLPETLKEYEYAPGVVVNWVMYGTSHVEKISKGEKMLDLLIYRAPLDFPENKLFKTIAKPEEIVACLSPHGFIFHNGNRAVDENHAEKAFTDYNSISVNKLRINHYWCRDNSFFHNVKIPRRLKFFNEEETLAINDAMNVECDPVLSSQKD
jgi:hypothetical protein